MKRKPMGSLAAITLRLSVLVLGIWLVCIGLLMVGTALYVFQAVREQGMKLAEQAGSTGQLDACYLDGEYDLQQAKAIPGFLEHGMLWAVKNAAVKIGSPGYFHSNIWRSMTNCKEAKMSLSVWTLL